MPKKIGYRGSRAFIEETMSKDGLTLVEAVVDFLDSHEIPIKKVRQYLDPGLYDKLIAELEPLRKNAKNKITLFSFMKEIKK